jgi:murein DD-endopeptidase MepM/ murein hydrolase activator NlpD
MTVKPIIKRCVTQGVFLALFFALALVPVLAALAEESASDNSNDADSAAVAADPGTDASAADAAESDNVVASGDEGLREQINNIHQDVEKKKNELIGLNKRIESFRSLVMQKKLESANLEDEIALLDNRIAKEQLDIDIAREEIKSLEMEIAVLDKEIRDQEAQMEQEKGLLGGLARKLYRAQFNRSIFEILLVNKTFSGFFDALHSMTKLQLAVDDSLNRVRSLKKQLADQKADRETKRAESQSRKQALEVAKMELEDERVLKDQILSETKSSELQFRYLLADLKNEQAEADSEIIYLEKALRQKLTLADRLGGESAVFSWPLVPARGLSSTFHDPDYPFRYIFEHPAIDIRASQGTAVRAAAAGIVARAKNAGMGYSYVMLLHNNDMATVYGHLSKIIAKEDTFVERGEIIGYSGGMPGTSGAGRLTTGPHLHFEVRKEGIPVDPLSFMMEY